MKKIVTFICILYSFSVITAFAASYKGNIWTGKPNFLGIGYYCVAAQNQSGGNVKTHWAKAWVKTPNGAITRASATGNNRAVAKCGKTKPIEGGGSYGEKGWSTLGSFKEGAWD